MKTILTDTDIPIRSSMGGKGFALAKLSNAHFPVPGWFLLTPEFAGIDATDLNTIDAFTFSAEQQSAIRNAIKELRDGNRGFAVRSSAIDEDGAQSSFAGQLDSFLNVAAEDVPQRIVDVWRSSFSERVSAYRHEKGLAEGTCLPAVIVQRMVDAKCAGVAFSVDAVTGRWSTALVSAVQGHGEKLVSGQADSENWILARDTAKTLEHNCPEAQGAVLTESQAVEVARMAWDCERYFGRPQDIEWAYEGGHLYLLQSRPITTLNQLADPDGVLNIWDNSNIAESYGGVTTPLTFSFAHYIYEEVYQQFCRIMHVSPTVIEDNRTIFGSMLGLIRGRVYYNLMSWYRMLALLPGFRFNRKFMEQMMGVKEGLPETVLSELESKQSGGRMRDGLRLCWAIAGLFKAQVILPRMINRFYRHSDKTLAAIEAPLEQMRADQLAAHFHQLEQQLLSRWNAPLVNDFFAMIYFGVLRALTQKWCDDDDGTLQNGLLCGTGNIVSAEPARRIRKMATVAADREALTKALCTADVSTALQQLSEDKELEKLYQSYLDRFADRCLNELKLESATLRDDPLPLLRSIGNLAKRIQDGLTESGNTEHSLQQEAEETVIEKLRAHPVRRLLFNYVLKQARRRVRDRENLRFERTRLFGRIRKIFVELGKRLHAINQLENARDVFYLKIDEVLGFVEGTAVTAQLKPLIEIRKTEFDGYAQTAPPADRFETLGTVHVGNQFAGASGTDSEEAFEGDLKGTGCCPGLVRGHARVVHNPKDANLQPGEILVAEQTDPGWITLFPASAGVLVQRGSLLSHTAIVSREMGIPAVVSISGLLAKVNTGDLLEFDGKSGVIRMLDKATTEH